MVIEALATELSERRRLLGLSREEAYKKFRVPPGFICAIEDAQLDQLPAPVYARGFLKSYCDGLGLAAEPRLSQLEEAFHRRPRFRVAFLGGGSETRPQWLDDAMMWAAIASIVVFGWLAYSAVVKPGAHMHQTGVQAETLELRDNDPFAAP